MIRHHTIHVNTDMQKEAGFKGSLKDFGANEINRWLEGLDPPAHIISIQEEEGSSEVQPVLCNSSTWYDRDWLELSIWYEQTKWREGNGN